MSHTGKRARKNLVRPVDSRSNSTPFRPLTLVCRTNREVRNFSLSLVISANKRETRKLGSSASD